ncbi:Inner membrane protein YebE [compost metagenome]
MSTRQILDQLLQSGQDMAKQWGNRQQGGGLQDQLGGLFGGSQTGNNSTATNSLTSLLTGFGGGAISGGALALLLSNKKARKVGGNIALYGGMAALGALAFKAYGDWQRDKAHGATGLAEPQTLDRLPAAQAEQHSSAILIAMIGAAKADGHIGPAETQLLEQEMAKLSADSADQRWLHEELSRPLDPAAVARAAGTPEMAAEMYLASLLVVDEETFMERAYLDQLAKELKLDADLKAKLEQQVAALATA